MLEVGLQNGHGALLLTDLAVQLAKALAQLLLLHIVFPRPLAKLLIAAVEPFQCGVGLPQLPLGGSIVCLQFHGLLLDALQVLQPHRNLQKPQFVPQH